MHLPRPYCIMIGHRLWEFQRPYSWQSRTPGSDGWQIMGNYLLVCPRCGETWARMWAGDLPSAAITWEVYPQLCERHPPVHSSSFPGSLFPGRWGFNGMRDPALFYHLPAELVQREFDLHLRRTNYND